MNLRIYFVGSHSTGKTTLARWTASYYGLPLISELARSVLAEREIPLPQLRHRTDLMGDVQEEIFRRQIEAEDRLDGSYVSDRSFDSLMYAAEHSYVAHKIYTSKEFQRYLQHIRGGLIFFVRPSRELLAEDGVRDEVNWGSVMQIDGAVKCFLEMHGLPYVPITPRSMQERTHIIRAVVDPSRRLAEYESQAHKGGNGSSGRLVGSLLERE